MYICIAFFLKIDIWSCLFAILKYYNQQPETLDRKNNKLHCKHKFRYDLRINTELIQTNFLNFLYELIYTYQM